MSLFTTLVTSKVAAGAIAVSTLAVGGTAAAAATNALPDPAQEIAHQVVGAPAPEDATAATTTTASAETGTETGTGDETAPADSTQQSSAEASTPSVPSSPTTEAKGPDATGPAAKGLCTAYTAGGLHNPKSTAYQALATAAAAGSPDGTTADTAITAYCLVVLGAPTTDSNPATVPSTAPRHVHKSHHHATAQSDDQGDEQGSETKDDSTEQEHSSVSDHKGSSHDEVTKSDDSNDDQGGDDQGENENEND